MDKYSVLELSAPVKATDDTCHDRCVDLCDSFIYETQGTDDDRREIARGPEHGARPPHLGRRAMTAPPAHGPPNPEVARLQRVLEDVRFCLERGDWRAGLAAARSAP
jgi:hypothetical protein